MSERRPPPAFMDPDEEPPQLYHWRDLAHIRSPAVTVHAPWDTAGPPRRVTVSHPSGPKYSTATASAGQTHVQAHTNISPRERHTAHDHQRARTPSTPTRRVTSLRFPDPMLVSQSASAPQRNSYASQQGAHASTMWRESRAAMSQPAQVWSRHNFSDAHQSPNAYTPSQATYPYNGGDHAVVENGRVVMPVMYTGPPQPALDSTAMPSNAGHPYDAYAGPSAEYTSPYAHSTPTYPAEYVLIQPAFDPTQGGMGAGSQGMVIPGHGAQLPDQFYWHYPAQPTQQASIQDAAISYMRVAQAPQQHMFLPGAYYSPYTDPHQFTPGDAPPTTKSSEATRKHTRSKRRAKPSSQTRAKRTPSSDDTSSSSAPKKAKEPQKSASSPLPSRPKPKNPVRRRSKPMLAPPIQDMSSEGPHDPLQGPQTAEEDDVLEELSPEEDLQARREAAIAVDTIPAPSAKYTPPRHAASECLWKPGNLPHHIVDKLLTQCGSLNLVVGMTEEEALRMLMDFNNDVDACVQALQWAVPICLDHRDYDHWTPEQMLDFERALLQYGKEFATIASKVADKTRADCVAYYYQWKKTKRGSKVIRDGRIDLKYLPRAHSSAETAPPNQANGALSSKDEKADDEAGKNQTQKAEAGPNDRATGPSNEFEQLPEDGSSMCHEGTPLDPPCNAAAGSTSARSETASRLNSPTHDDQKERSLTETTESHAADAITEVETKLSDKDTTSALPRDAPQDSSDDQKHALTTAHPNEHSNVWPEQRTEERTPSDMPDSVKRSRLRSRRSTPARTSQSTMSATGPATGKDVRRSSRERSSERKPKRTVAQSSPSDRTRTKTRIEPHSGRNTEPKKKASARQRPSKPSQDSAAQEEIFNVEKILNHRRRKGKSQREYLVKWEGYGHAANTWEPESNLVNNIVLMEYLSRQKSSVQAAHDGKRKKGPDSEEEDSDSKRRKTRRAGEEHEQLSNINPHLLGKELKGLVFTNPGPKATFTFSKNA